MAFIHEGTGVALARVEMGADMAVESVAPVIDKQKALAYLTDAIDRVEDNRIHQVARDMKALNKKQPSDC